MMVPPQSQVTLPFNAGVSAAAPLNTIYDHLLLNNHFTDQLEPHLATEWSMAPNGKDWTFKLREGVTFHNGDTFDAQDVKGSYIIRMNNTTPKGGRSGTDSEIFDLMGGTRDPFRDGSENIEIVNDHEVIYHLQSAFLGLGPSLSEGNGVLQNLSWDHWQDVGIEGYGTDPVGTGPFKFVDLVIDQYLLVERFKQPGDDWWWQAPDFDEIQIFYVAEGQTRVAMLLTEEAHIADIPSLLIPEAVSRGMKKAPSTLPGAEFFIHFGGAYHEGDPGYHSGNPVLIKEVRGALNHAIDRDVLLNTFFEGRAQPGRVAFFNPNEPKHRAEWVPYAFDQSLARQLLTDAGFPNGLDVEVLVGTNMSGVSEAPDVVEAIVAMWEEVGFNVDFRPVEFGTVLAELRNPETSNLGGELKAKLFAYRFGTRSDLGLLPLATNRALPKGGGLQMFNDPVIADFRDAYISEIDLDERTRLELAYGDHHYDNYGQIPLFWISAEVMINPTIVVDYQVNLKNFGPVRSLEFVKGVRK